MNYNYVILFLFSVLVSSVSQILLKKSTKKEYDSFLAQYLNFPTMFAYFLFFLSSLMTVFAYKGVPLSLGPVLEATGYIYVSVLGYIFLKEKISKKKALGLGLIIAGIVVFNLQI